MNGCEYDPDIYLDKKPLSKIWSLELQFETTPGMVYKNLYDNHLEVP